MGQQTSPYVGEIRLVSFNFAPAGYAMCNGQFMSIAQNQALFALLGTMYGGNGQTTFALPDLRGRSPLHFGSDFGGSNFTMGQKAGEEFHTVSISEMPQHNHLVNVKNRPGTSATPGNNFLAAHRGGYASAGDVAMHPGVVINTGGSQPHENRPPYLVLNYCIALFGVFPSQN